jgi:NDP-sugar pyrophosphorylase family protein
MANMTSEPTPAALVLAAGESSRFWPLSVNQHKSLFRLAGISLLERTIGSLIDAGINEIVVVQSPRSSYAQPGAAVLPSDCLPADYAGAHLAFVEQPIPAGQGDAIARGAHLLGDHFLVVQPENINAGDIAIDLMRAAAPGDVAVVAGQERADFRLYAVLQHHAERLTGIVEKPATAATAEPLCSMGVYLFRSAFTRCLADFEPDPLSIIFAIDRLAKEGKASVCRTRQVFLPLKYPGHLWAYARYLKLWDHPADGGGSDAANGSAFDPRQADCIISAGCSIGDRVSMRNAILAPGVVIGAGTRVEATGSWADLDAVAIGPGATIGTNVTIAPRVRIGAGATIGSGLRVDADVPDLATIELQAAGQPSRR